MIDPGPSNRGGVPWSSGAAYVDGAHCPIEDAKISVLDWGLTRSDCTYDVVHVWNGRFFRLDDHLDRFRAGMRRLRLDPDLAADELESILHECVRRSGLRDAYVSMTCTRGRPAPGSRDPRTCRNTLYCYAIPFVWIVSPQEQATGARLWISDVERIPAESVDPRIKNYHWLDMTTALLQAVDEGAELVLLRDQRGRITEGPGYNVFVLRSGRWLTPSSGTLRGITRRTVLELCAMLDMAAEEGDVSVDDVVGADEVLVTSTAGGIMPVTMVNGSPVGPGEPGPHTIELRERYWAMHDDQAWSTPIDYGLQP